MGIRIGRRIVKLWKWMSPKSRPCSSSYTKLDQEDEQSIELIKRENKKKKKLRDELCRAGVAIKRNFSGSCLRKRDDEEVIKRKGFKAGLAPKGHLVVYVGRNDDNQRRFVVPVIDFNHPLFGQLLKESEEEYGFSQPGGITFPCQVSYFKTVLERIAGERFSDKWREITSRRKRATARLL